MPSSASPAPRGLVSPRGVEHWATFVASCFAFKVPPPSREHFLRHFQQDPFSSDPSFIRAIVDADDGSFMATVRLVLRPVQVGEQQTRCCWAAGLAEVCVAAAHRGKGLAQRVVEDVLAHAATLGPPLHATPPCLSVLHCAPELLPVYGRMGYVSVPVHWVRVAVNPRSGSTLPQPGRGLGVVVVAPLDLGAPGSIDELAALPRPVPGILTRQPAYWQAWVHGEVSAGTAAGNVQVWGVREEGKLLAYAMLRRQGDASLVLLDAGLDSSRTRESPPLATILQLAAAFATAETTLRLPKALLGLEEEEEAETKKSDVVVVKEETDVGWMYKPLPGHEESEEWKAVLGLQQAGHVIWPIDHF